MLATTDPWTGFLDWLSRIIVPDWSTPIMLLPLLFAGLAGLFVLFLAYQAVMAIGPNRTRVRRPLPPGAPPGVHVPGQSRWPFLLPFGVVVLLFGVVVRPGGSVVNVPVVALGLLLTAAVLAGWLRESMGDWRHVEAGPTGAAAGHLPTGMGGAATYLPAPRAAAAAAAETAPVHHGPAPSPWPFFVPIGAAFVLFGLVINRALLAGGLVMLVLAIAGWFRDAGREYHQVEAGHLPGPSTRDPERLFPKALVGVYALVAAASVGLAVAPSIVAFANATPAPAVSAAPGAGGASTSISIVAQGVKFSVSSFTVPANTAFTITFENRDTVPHNVAIYDSDKLTTNLFRGTIFPGPKTVTYQVPALPAGTYYFHCDVHPIMNGSVVVQ